MARSVSSGAFNLANGLTVARIAAAPVLAYLILNPLPGGAKWPTALLFAVAAITDWFDGYVARTRGQESKLGAMLDPVADKVFGVTLLWALAFGGLLPAWMLWSLVVKEGLLLLGGVMLLARGVEVSKARALGKVATGFLFVGFGMTLVDLWSLGPLTTGIGVALSLLAGVDYALVAARSAKSRA